MIVSQGMQQFPYGVLEGVAELCLCEITGVIEPELLFSRYAAPGRRGLYSGVVSRLGQLFPRLWTAHRIRGRGVLQ